MSEVRNNELDVKERNEDNSKGGKNLPQYGKKGHKPRKPYNTRKYNLDDIHTNDPSYWNKTSNYDNVTKFSWDLMLGFPRSLDGLDSADKFKTLKYTSPTIAKIEVVMGPGWAENVNDGVNRSLAMVMADIRASLSTSNIGFETADLGIFLASTASIANNIGFAKRVLESYVMWADRNYAYPRGLCKAQGFSYDDIRDNINVYASRLNAIIDMYNNMSIPDMFDIYDRQYAMMHSVFIDEDSELGQMYIFMPVNYYEYDDENFRAKCNRMPKFDGSPGDFARLLDIIEAQIQAWYSSSDLYQINGVLLRAFKDVPRQSMPHYELYSSITPVVDRAFLMQIMNATIYTGFNSSQSHITQNPSAQNYVIWQPRFNVPSVTEGLYVNSKFILRLFENDPSQDDNMELTRLFNMGYRLDTINGVEYATIPHCGSEIVTSISVGYYDSTLDALNMLPFDSNFITLNSDDAGIDFTTFSAILSMQNFRYIPAIFVIGEDNSNFTLLGMLGDVYNWMVYNYADWKELQNVAYQSLWKPKNV